MENTVGEMENKKSFVGGYDSPIRTGGGVNYITSKDLNDPEEMYQVGTAQFAPSGTTIISTKTADTKNSDANTLDTTASSANLSAKYKYPNVSQSTSQMPKESGEYDEASI